MRVLLGWLLFFGGVAGLIWWAATQEARQIEFAMTAHAEAVAEGALHPIEVRVSGRDIEVLGLADTNRERGALLASFNAIEGRRVVRNRLGVLPSQSPYVTSFLQSGEGAISVGGFIPVDALRSELQAQGVGDVAALILASGATVEWRETVHGILAILTTLEAGEAELTGNRLTLSGTARTSIEMDEVEGIVAALPSHIEAEVSGISLLDDGTPAQFTIQLDADDGANVSGKLHAGLTLDELSRALGVTILGDGRRALTGDRLAPEQLVLLARLRPWMGYLEEGTISVGADKVDVALNVVKGADAELIKEALRADLGSTARLNVSEANIVRPDGESRRNALTGDTEQLRNGFWLQERTDFVPDISNCEAVARAALNDTPIAFLTGSARLDARALRGVNALASILGRCVREAGLLAEIGGHTDDTGDAEANMTLSIARARVVHSELIARGIASNVIGFRGYGATQPIANNRTSRGRALNRRTAVTWRVAEQ